jgi:hypothetical protein
VIKFILLVLVCVPVLAQQFPTPPRVGQPPAPVVKVPLPQTVTNPPQPVHPEFPKVIAPIAGPQLMPVCH